MGTKSSHAHEWIELSNNTSLPLCLDGWKIISRDGVPSITLTGNISAKGFYLLERTSDETLPEISANQIYTGALNNKGEYLELFDDKGNLIDKINCEKKWFAGNNSSKHTMERKNPLLTSSLSNWQTSKKPGGTPGTKNSSGVSQKEPQKFDIKSKPSNIISRPRNIIFNELLPSPQGPDKEKEWVELFNKNNFEVHLSGWKIFDKVGATSTYIFPEETKICASGFLLLFRKETKITLNNKKDELVLTDTDNKVIDKVAFEHAPTGKSFSKTASGWVWSKIPTPGRKNIIAEQPNGLQNKKENSNQLEKKNTSLSSENKEKNLLAANQTLSTKNHSFLRLLTIGLSIGFFSGILILTLKKRLKKLINR